MDLWKNKSNLFSKITFVVYLATYSEAQAFHLFAVTVKWIFKLFFSLKMHMTWNTEMTYNFGSFSKTSFEMQWLSFH